MRFARARWAAVALTLPLLSFAALGCVERKVSSITGSGSIDIVELSAEPDTIFLNQQSILSAVIDNPEGQELTYNWQAYRGAISGTGSEVRYFGSYCCAGTDWVVLTVTDEDGGQVQETAVLFVFGATQ